VKYVRKAGLIFVETGPSVRSDAQQQVEVEQAGCRGFGVRLPAGVKCSQLHVFQTGSVAHMASHPRSILGSFIGR
jgi:hypothetical protein